MENRSKLRILYLYQYLIQNTTSGHPQSTAELTKMLSDKYGIDVSRNTISDDLAMLCSAQFQIKMIRSTQNKYYYDGQVFDIPEMKLLIDAVSSSRFITERKSEALVNKLLSLVSPDDAIKLRRHIYASDRVKSENECGYLIVDTINDAINTRHKISFHYTDLDVFKNRHLTNNGQEYTVSPYTLIWDGDYYYLRGFCDERNALRTFRVDRIEGAPTILCDLIVPKPDDYSIAEYSKSVFRMYDTDKPVMVSLKCDVTVMKAVVDIFGNDVDTKPINEEVFTANVRVCPSPTFYSWVFCFHGLIKIQSPESIVQEYRSILDSELKSIKDSSNSI